MVKRRKRRTSASRQRPRPRQSVPRNSRKPRGTDAEMKTDALLNHELSEAVEQQAAASEVLQAISRSPGELEPVFQAILSHATRFCDATYGAIWLKDGDRFRNAAFHGALPAAYIEQWRSAAVGRTAPLGRVAQSRKPLQIADLREDQEPLVVLDHLALGRPPLVENIVLPGVEEQVLYPRTGSQDVANIGPGYVVILQDTRGRFDSEGEFDPFAGEQREHEECCTYECAERLDPEPATHDAGIHQWLLSWQSEAGAASRRDQ